MESFLFLFLIEKRRLLALQDQPQGTAVLLRLVAVRSCTAVTTPPQAPYQHFSI